MNKGTSRISTISILITNLITFYGYVSQKISFGTVLFIYFAQGIILGYFFYRKIIYNKNIIIGGLYSGKKYFLDFRYDLLKKRFGERKATAFVFFFQYCFIHLVYLILIFLIYAKNNNFGANNPLFDPKYVLAGVIIFFLSHLISYITNRKNDFANKVELKNVYGSMYLRVIPLHLIIFFAGVVVPGNQSDNTIIFFLILFKIFMDIVLHLREHKEYRINQDTTKTLQ